MTLGNYVILMPIHLVDNVSEITAKTNDEGFETIFDTYLKLSKFNKKDILMVFSLEVEI